MSMSERKPSTIIRDILKSIDHINTYTNNLSFEEFSLNFMVVEACLYNIQVIGEAVSMLRLFEHPMPDKAYDEIKRFVVKILTEKVDVEMERLEKEKGWTPDTYEQWGKEHLRTPYKK